MIREIAGVFAVWLVVATAAGMLLGKMLSEDWTTTKKVPVVRHLSRPRTRWQTPHRRSA
jgi:hypothetical protein